MSRRGLLGFAAAGCVACCAGPFLATIGAVAALGILGTFAFGFAALIAAGLAITVLVMVRRRPSAKPSPDPEPARVELGPANR